MTRLAASLSATPSAVVWPLAVTGVTGFFLSSIHLEPIYCLFFLSLCVILSLSAGRFLRNAGLKSLFRRSLLLAACVILLSLMMPPARGAVITEYSMDGDPRPHGIAIDTGGTVWFTEQLMNRIGYVSGSQVVEYNIPTGVSEPWGIVYDPNLDRNDPNADSVWFTESQPGADGVARIGRLKDGVFAEFVISHPGNPGALAGGSPRGIIFDYNVSQGVKYKNIWFVEYTGNTLGKIYYNASGRLSNRWIMTEYAVPDDMKTGTGASGAGPIDLARNPVNGFIFFCSYTANNIASLNPWTGAFRVYYVSNAITGGPAYHLTAIDVGSDGIVWAALDYVDPLKYDKIVRLDPWISRIVTYEIPTQGSGPRDITVDNDKNVWFTEYDVGKIGRLNPITNYVTEYALPVSGSNPLCLATSTVTGSTVWFTEWSNNKIGSLDPTSALKPVTVNTITSATTSTSTAPTTSLRASTTTRSVIWSTSTTEGEAPVVSFTTAGYTLSSGGTAFTTMSTFVRYATVSQTTNTETVFVIPTSVTASTTSTFTSTTSTTTTISPTLTTAVQTVSSSTTTTTLATFSTPVQTDTTLVTRQQVYTDYVTTTTETNFAGTSFRFTTVTLPTFTRYSTSTLGTTTTVTGSTVTLTWAAYTTTTIFVTVTAGVVGPALFLLAIPAFLRIRDQLRRRPVREGENQ